MYSYMESNFFAQCLLKVSKSLASNYHDFLIFTLHVLLVIPLMLLKKWNLPFCFSPVLRPENFYFAYLNLIAEHLNNRELQNLFSISLSFTVQEYGII